jgi:hypothetical protein
MRSAETLANHEGPGAASRARTMMTLQRRVGNNRVSNLIGSVQTKLTVGEVDDPHEREADRVAEAVPQQAQSHSASPVLRQFVMKHSLTPAGSAQPQIAREEDKPEPDEAENQNAKPEQETKQTAEEDQHPETNKPAARIQRKEATGADNTGTEADTERRIASPTGGQPLPEGLQSQMESSLGADFSQVRVHDNAQDQADAGRLNAKAFTHGEHIWLGAGESTSDRKLMAHELTHVVQQGGGEIRRQPVEDDETENPTPETEASSPEEASTTETEVASPEPQTISETEVAPPAEVSTAPPATAEPDIAPVEPESELAAPETGPPDTAAAPSLPPEQPPEAGDLQATIPTEAEAAAPEVGASETPAETDLSLGTESPSFAPAPNDAAATGLIQRDAVDEDEGILAGIRRRIRGAVDGLRAGWDSLSSMVTGAFDAIRTQISGLLDSLRNVITSALSVLQNAWSRVVARVQQLADGLKRMVQAGLGAVFEAAQAIGSAFIRLDPIGLRGAWTRLTTLLSGVNQRVQQALQVVFNAIGSLWQGLRTQFDGIVNRITTGAAALRTQAQSLVQGLRSRVTSAWQGLRDRAGQLSGVLGGVLERLRSLLSSLLEWGEQIWGRIQQGFSALSTRLSGFVQLILQRVMSAWQTLRQRAAGLWTRLQALWGRFTRSITQLLQRLASGIRSIWNRIVALSIEGLLTFLEGLRDIYHGMQQLYDDVRAFFAPFAEKITDMVFAAMPGKALEFAQTQIAQVLGTSAIATPEQRPSETEETAVETKVQRVPRDTANLSEIGTGFWDAIKAIWRQVTWSSILDMVLDALLEQLFPPLAVYRQIRDFIFQDMRALGRGLFMPRNILSDPLGALHDLYTNLYHLVVDFVTSLLRRVINILMAFQFWITFVLTVAGLIGGSVVVGILGGILAGLATVGIGAGAGAAGGALAGGAAGAGVGFGVALAIGEAVFFAFLAIHAATIYLTLIDLLTTLQSREEKERDYAQLAESAIAVGVGLALLALAWLAGTIAKGVAALIERLGIKIRIPLPPALSRFLRGVGSTRPPGPGSLTPAEQAARLAAEQRLSRLISGDLARLLVNDLGPVLAEEIVARLGASAVERLAAELAPEAIARIAQNLAQDAVERLLDGGMSPKRIDAAVVAGQADRLAAMTTEQIGRLSALSDEGFTRIVQLPENQFQRFINLGETQLRVFAEMDRAAFNRFAALDDPTFVRFSAMGERQLGAFAEMEDAAFGRFTALDDATFARFRTLTADQLEAFARMSDDAFARYTTLSDANFAKFAGFPPDTLAKFGNLSDAAFARYAALNQTDLAKFANVGQASLERMASRLAPGELERIATLTQPEIHRQVLGFDPAPMRFRANEADTALRVEAKRSIVLDRFAPATAADKGDWFDVASGEVYDGCSPPESRFFNQQITNGRFEAALREHLNHPGVNFVVIDITGLGLTPAQEVTLDALIERVAGPGNPKILRIP